MPNSTLKSDMTSERPEGYISPSRTKATWKPGITDDSIPFFYCPTCKSVLPGIDGANNITSSGLVRRPDYKLPYATNEFAPSCCGETMQPLVGDKTGTNGKMTISYQVVGGFDMNTLRVFWKSKDGSKPIWIAVKTFTGMLLKYVFPDKYSPITFGLSDEDAYAYCDEDPCLACTFHCKRGFEIYAYLGNGELLSLPMHVEDLQKEKGVVD